ncbi:hypothetical protein SANTM175S_10158 [Streptomyces antimycoticus]
MAGVGDGGGVRRHGPGRGPADALLLAEVGGRELRHRAGRSSAGTTGFTNAPIAKFGDRRMRSIHFTSGIRPEGGGAQGGGEPGTCRIREPVTDPQGERAGALQRTVPLGGNHADSGVTLSGTVRSAEVNDTTRWSSSGR